MKWLSQEESNQKNHLWTENRLVLISKKSHTTWRNATLQKQWYKPMYYLNAVLGNHIMHICTWLAAHAFLSCILTIASLQLNFQQKEIGKASTNEDFNQGKNKSTSFLELSFAIYCLQLTFHVILLT